MDRWTQYLFERHDEAELRNWARRLCLFRFFRAFGGHVNDGDSLDCAFRYHSIRDLELFFSLVGIEPVRFNLKPLQPEPGVPYPGNIFDTFPSLIPGTEWIKQPGHCEIGGNKAFVWCHADKIVVSATGGSHDVSEAAVENAERLEEVLKIVPLRLQDPPRDTNHYICPKYYPSYFS
jgi:hypothetical protein